MSYLESIPGWDHTHSFRIYFVDEIVRLEELKKRDVIWLRQVVTVK